MTKKLLKTLSSCDDENQEGTISYLARMPAHDRGTP